MHATLIYPHQLFHPRVHPALAAGRPVFVIEEPLLLTEFPTHRQKCLLHRLSLRAFADELAAAGYRVTYLDAHQYQSTAATLKAIVDRGYRTWHVVDTTDVWLERRLAKGAAQHGATRVRYESPLFLLSAAEAVARYRESGRFMARFYQKLRKEYCLLIEDDGTPVGGRWSFDVENRKKVPHTVTLPADITTIDDAEVRRAQEWLVDLPGERYGETAVWVPYTRAAAAAYLEIFFRERFASFGPYEDALHPTHVRLFHSALSPLINIGLLSPRQVLDAALAYAATHAVPLPSLEGFVRQVLGWREFIRASYECDGVTMRNKNFFDHTAPLPQGMWDATTGLAPLDTAIKNALRCGYTHHIERLMVIGNYLLLCETNPHAVYRWFMAMYVDAYDWVMVPNVYGMSQFADGGSFATKPYIAGGNYLHKLSHFKKDAWYDVYTALFWRFLERHETFFMRNPRLSMLVRSFRDRPAADQNRQRSRAEAHLRAVRESAKQ
jgi:deoxyribodipyrimidine photolyase-related protein